MGRFVTNLPPKNPPSRPYDRCLPHETVIAAAPRCSQGLNHEANKETVIFYFALHNDARGSGVTRDLGPACARHFPT